MHGQQNIKILLCHSQRSVLQEIVLSIDGTQFHIPDEDLFSLTHDILSATWHRGYGLLKEILSTGVLISP